METALKLSKELSKDESLALIIAEDSDISSVISDEKIVKHVKHKLKQGDRFVELLDFAANRHIFFIVTDKKLEKYSFLESLRNYGSSLSELILKHKIESLQVTSLFADKNEILCVVEGLLLGSYKFDKYKSNQQKSSQKNISVYHKSITEKDLTELAGIAEAVLVARNLVNEPACNLTAEQLASEIKSIGKRTGFSVEVFEKAKIKSLKMGGLLGVNEGSVDPPVFCILEYKSPEAKNKKPLVLVGKGVVFDTGGLSLKDAEGMEHMKADMAGAAAVAGVFSAIAKNKLPVHVIGLIPATDNRPSGNAMAPGDVITIFGGKTVEVLNTDAEGRLILADALCYAKKYNPDLVIDLATLTGAAARAIGKEGVVCMGTANRNIMSGIIESSMHVHERLVEFPLWPEYGKELESDIADIKNIGSPLAGAITAGKFLHFFTDYPWIHIDIAGMAFLKSADSYRPKNGTGVGVRLLYNFINKLY